MANYHVKRYSTSLPTGKNYNDIHHIMLSRMNTIKVLIIINVDINVEKLEPSYFAAGIENWCSHYGKHFENLKS